MENAKFKNVLVDLDHTLCSTEHGVTVALEHFANQYAVKNLSHLKKHFSELNTKLFEKYLHKQFSINEFRIRRYEQLLNLPGILRTNCNSLEEEANAFTDMMNKNCILFEDTIDFLKYLQSKRVKVALLTNGPADGQRTKLESLGISNFFDAIYISGETGFEKPNAIAFTNALNSLQADHRHSVMLGDSMECDIIPAVRLGMRAILLDRADNFSNTDPLITTVRSLKTLQTEDFIG